MKPNHQHSLLLYFSPSYIKKPSSLLEQHLKYMKYKFIGKWLHFHYWENRILKFSKGVSPHHFPFHQSSSVSMTGKTLKREWKIFYFFFFFPQGKCFSFLLVFNSLSFKCLFSFKDFFFFSGCMHSKLGRLQLPNCFKMMQNRT